MKYSQKLGRNDPCPCGSGKKYKKCCLLNYKKAGFASIKKIPISRIAMEQFKKDPRSATHWHYTNMVIDEILRKRLRNAPILKYNPYGWIQCLHLCYFILKSHYWFNVYEYTIKKNEESFKSMPLGFIFRWIRTETPLYIRIISLLLHICFDRIGLNKYDKLPNVPIKYLFEVQHKGVGPYISDGIFKYIDEITNNASKEINYFFTESRGAYSGIKENIIRDIFLPIPTFAIPKFIEFCKNLNKKYSKKCSFKDVERKVSVPTTDGDFIDLTIFLPAFIKFIEKPIFHREILPNLVDFLRKIYTNLSDTQQGKELQEICNFFYFFFKNLPLDFQRPFYQIVNILDEILILEGIDPDILHKNIHNVSLRKSIANLWKINNIFQYSLDLFKRPFVQDRLGRVHFSVLWLFDSLIFKITKLLEQRDIGLSRGLKTENYLAYFIKNYVEKTFPNAPFKGPCKIILLNKDLKHRGRYNEFKKYFSNFKYNIYKFLLTENEINMKRLSFIEFDIAFLFHDTLFIVDSKDNLFWDVKDLPAAIVLWGKKMNEKLKKNILLLQNAIIKRKFEELGIKYKKIESMVISQGHIESKELHIPYDLIKKLHQIDYTARTNDESEHIFFWIEYEWPPYPW